MEHPELEDLAAYLEGKLSPSERTWIAGHLASCEECYEVFTETILALEEDAPQAGSEAGGDLARFPFDPLPRGRRQQGPAEREALLGQRRPAGGRGWMAGAAAAVLALGIGWVSYRELIAPPEMTIARATADLGKAQGLSRGIWTGEVTRGGEQNAPPPVLSAQSFQLGALEVALEVSWDDGNTQAAAEACRQIGNVLEQLTFQDDGVRLFRRARTALESGKPSPGLYRSLTETLAGAEPELSPLYLRFGRWTEAARVAAYTGREDFFAARANRRFLELLREDPARLEDPDLLDSGRPPEIDPAVTPHLQEIATIWEGGVHGAELERIRRPLDAILQFYFRPPPDDLPGLAE